eukprot:841910-Prymnesium_polylepis.1
MVRKACERDEWLCETLGPVLRRDMPRSIMCVKPRDEKIFSVATPSSCEPTIFTCGCSSFAPGSASRSRHLLPCTSTSVACSSSSESCAEGEGERWKRNWVGLGHGRPARSRVRVKASAGSATGSGWVTDRAAL